MAEATIERRGEKTWDFGLASAATTVSTLANWEGSPAWEERKRTFRFRVYLQPEEEGGFSVYLPDLPGVVSQGETEREALENAKEAFQGVAGVYLESGSIPWQRSSEDKPKEAKELWIVVDV